MKTKSPALVTVRGFFLQCRSDFNDADFITPRIIDHPIFYITPVMQLDKAQTTVVWITLTCTGALPGIGSDMVVITARRHKHRFIAIGSNRVEAEFLMPPTIRLLRIAN